MILKEAKASLDISLEKTHKQLTPHKSCSMSRIIRSVGYPLAPPRMAAVWRKTEKDGQTSQELGALLGGTGNSELALENGGSSSQG